MHQPQQDRVLVLIGSPRRDGNSARLGEAVGEGAAAAGARAEVCVLDDYIAGFLGDDAADPALSEDRYGALFLDRFLPARGVVFCTPIYWYGMSAQTKAFFDRSFSYYRAGAPDAPGVLARMTGKRLGLTLASEESYPGAALGIVHQVQEFARYTRSAFIGWVHGVGNHRGEVAYDPSDPLARARRLGEMLLTGSYSDHRIDTPRDHCVWPRRARGAG